ncbi:MAG: acyl carrier protein [Desulfobacterales bacterium]
MKAEETRARVVDILTAIAPEVDPDRIQGAVPFREQFTFDSVDFLSFAIKLQESFDLKIPETDYPRLSTLDGCVGYIGKIS